MHATLTQDYTLLGSQFSTRKKVHFQFTFKRNFNIRIRVSFQNENHNERILECSLLAKASFPRYSSPRGGGGGGWRYSKTFYKRRLRPKVQPLTLLYTIFVEKGPLLNTVEPLRMATLRTEESGHCREVETSSNVWTVRPKKMAIVERWLEVAVSEGLTVPSIIDKIIY